ncbi:MAG TPA: hypothetical protein VKY31_06025, partial [Terriglobia bacterium]|nr:hypothetical protein [Terriglobia bacterium]
MRTGRLAWSALVLTWAFAGIIIGQTLIVDVNLTVLTVRVHDETGHPVLDLAPQDFEIFEDGHARPLSHFSVETQPATIGILVDRSISVGPVRN